jgi:GNAT superfamily N-acetyltransferase
VIERRRLDDSDAVRLTGASISEIDRRHGGDPGSGAPPRPEEFEPPDGVFLVVCVDGEAVGCGGLCRLDGETAEVRRMYVAPERRGLGLSKTVLAELEAFAREAGYCEIKLETGNKQAEALGLYRSAGYREIPCYGPYVDDPKSVCFAKTLG